MLFDSLADKMIWLMLVSDRKNRNIIVEYINMIPLFVHEQIVTVFNEYNNGVSSIGVSGVASISDGSINYTISINDDQFKLRIFKYTSNENCFQEMFELSFMLFSDDIFYGKYTCQFGKFKYEKQFLNNYCGFQTDKIFNSYYMRNTLVGLIISNDYSLLPRIVSLDNLFDNDNISNFINKCNKNILVRRRNR
jgi:hypothetical protein